MNGFSKWMLENKDLITSWTAILAVLASAASLVAAAASMAIQRSHNRKSVQPIGHINVGDYENHLFVRLCNYGIGPMIIKWVIVGEGEQQSKAALIDLMPDLPSSCSWTNFVGDVSGRVVPANGHITLVELKGGESKDYVAARERVRKALSCLTLKVEYRDVYGTDMQPSIRTLDWFGRHWAEEA